MIHCPNCESEKLSYHFTPLNQGMADDGRLSLSEIRVVLVLGCEECSETVQIIESDAVARFLTDSYTRF